MAQVYMLRHQAAGFIPQFVFANEPTEMQIAAVARMCEARHGIAHPKTEEPYWICAVPVDLVEGGAVPALEISPGTSVSSGSALASVPGAEINGVGFVKNPE